MVNNGKGTKTQKAEPEWFRRPVVAFAVIRRRFMRQDDESSVAAEPVAAEYASPHDFDHMSTRLSDSERTPALMPREKVLAVLPAQPGIFAVYTSNLSPRGSGAVLLGYEGMEGNAEPIDWDAAVANYKRRVAWERKQQRKNEAAEAEERASEAERP